MLERRLFRRKSTGEVIDPDWLQFSFPTWWHYDVLRGLDYLRDAGVAPDERIAEAIERRRGQPGCRRPLAAPERPRGRGPLRDGRRRGQAEPLEHAPRAARARLVRRRWSAVTTFPGPDTALTHILVVADPAASRAWYTDVLGATVYREYAGSVVLSFGAAWLLLVEGGQPTDDKPDVTLAPPADPNIRDNLFTIRVDDCRAPTSCCVAAAGRFSPNRSRTATRRAASSAIPTDTFSRSVSTGRRSDACARSRPSDDGRVNVVRRDIWRIY